MYAYVYYGEQCDHEITVEVHRPRLFKSELSNTSKKSELYDNAALYSHCNITFKSREEIHASESHNIRAVSAGHISKSRNVYEKLLPENNEHDILLNQFHQSDCKHNGSSSSTNHKNEMLVEQIKERNSEMVPPETTNKSRVARKNQHTNVTQCVQSYTQPPFSFSYGSSNPCIDILNYDQNENTQKYPVQNTTGSRRCMQPQDHMALRQQITELANTYQPLPEPRGVESTTKVPNPNKRTSSQVFHTVESASYVTVHNSRVTEPIVGMSIAEKRRQRINKQVDSFVTNGNKTISEEGAKNKVNSTQSFKPCSAYTNNSKFIYYEDEV